MADAGSLGGTGETAVGQEGHRFAQAHAGDHGSGIQHFPHARTALGSFIADHHHVTRFDFLAHDGFDGFVF